MVEILDSTLREGEQTPGVRFSLDQKLDVAMMLDEFGVDFIEAGHPIISEEIKNAIKKIADQRLKAQVVGHARAKIGDVDAVIDSNAQWVGIFLGVNEISLKHKIHCSLEDAFEMIVDSIKYAKDHGLKVRYTLEDATRTNIEDLIEASRKAVEAGADRISIADTVGTATPTSMKTLVEKLKQLKVPLNIHWHNDFGLAVANSLAAYEAGVTLIDTTVNGLGERSGITPLHKICVTLNHFHNENHWKLEMLPELSRKVAEYSRIPLSTRTPILGEHAFTHKADLHVKAVLANPSCYESISPKKFGLKRTISYV